MDFVEFGNDEQTWVNKNTNEFVFEHAVAKASAW